MALPPRAIHRVTIKQLQRLLESCNAHRDYISEDQLLAFLRNPSGPILPDSCLEAKRLPDDWGTEDKAVWDLTVTPDGKPCMVTKFHGKTNAVICGDQTYELCDDILVGGRPRIIHEVTVPGFGPNGEPLAVITKFDVIDTLSDKTFTEPIRQETRLGCEPITHEAFEKMLSASGKDNESAPKLRLPSFDLVSPTFERHGLPYCYGVLGRHLYTMEIPGSEAPSP